MSVVSRRHALTALVASGLAPAILRGRYRLFAQQSATYSARAIGLVQSSVVIDLLNQFQFPDYRVRPPKSEQWLNDPHTFTAEDAARYKASGITVFCLGTGADTYDDAMKFMAQWNGFLAVQSDTFMRIDRAADIARAKAERKIGRAHV